MAKTPVSKEAAAAPASKKTACPITREQFAEAKPVTIQIGSIPMVASPKEFSTGSMGWYATGKTVIEVDGVPCQVQVGLNLTIVGSKEV